MLKKFDQRIDQWVATLTRKQSLFLIAGLLLLMGGIVASNSRMLGVSLLWSVVAGIGVIVGIAIFFVVRAVVKAIIKVRSEA